MNSKPIKINYYDSNEHWVPISGYSGGKRIKRSKELFIKRGNCFFAKSMSKKLMDFAFRSALKLELTSTPLIFSKGAVKNDYGKNINNACSVQKLDWDVGISIKIPYRLNYNTEVKFRLNDKIYSLKQMELLVLGMLLKIRYPSTNRNSLSLNAAAVLCAGWPVFNIEKPLNPVLINS